MADEPLFQQPSEANQALDKETRLPMTGWQQEVDQGLDLWVRGGGEHSRSHHPHLFAR
jgi:hypothetical protein